MKRYRELALQRYEEILRLTQPDFERESRSANRLYRYNHLPHLPQSPDARILDVGSGFGLFLHFLKECGYERAEGVDLSKGCVRLCAERGLKVTQSEIEAFMVERPKTFDCICLNHIFEHFDKDEGLAVLEAAFASLKPDGQLVIVLPNMANPITAARTRWADITHESGYTEESISTMCRLAGFADAKCYPIDIYVLPNPLFNLAGRMAACVWYFVLRTLFLLSGVRSTRVFTKHLMCVARPSSE